MAILFTNQTTNGDSAKVQPGGPCTILASGVFDGAYVEYLFGATELGDFDPPVGTNLNGQRQPGSVNCDAQAGYWLMARLQNAGTNTNVSIETTP